MARIMSKQAGQALRGGGSVFVADGPLNSGGRAELGFEQGGGFHSHKAPCWGLGSPASGSSSWGGGCGWDSRSLAFPGTAGSVPRLPAFRRLPWELLASPQPCLCQWGERRKGVDAHGLLLGTGDQ